MAVSDARMCADSEKGEKGDVRRQVTKQNGG